MSRKHKRTNEATAIKPVRVAIYTRKSIAKGLDRDDNTLQFQREACEAHVHMKRNDGWVVVPTHYNDGGFTGANTDRPALQLLLADAKAGNFDAVIVYKVDRISRSVRDLVLLVEEFQALGIDFISVSQNFDTSSSMGRLILNVLGSFSQFERETIVERIRDKVDATRRKGKFIGGMPPYGYRLHPQERRLVVDPEEAETVRAIFAAYEEKRSIAALLDDLHEKGLRTKQRTTKAGKTIGGKLITRQYLTNMLRNRTYAGQVAYKGEIFEGEHDAIMTPEYFDTIQGLLDRNKRYERTKTRTKRDILLRDLLFCQHAETAMNSTYTHKEGAKYFYYICSAQKRYGRCACKRKRVPADRIEHEVIAELRALAKNKDLLRTFAAHSESDRLQKECALAEKLKKLQTERAACHEFDERIAALDWEIAAVSAALKEQEYRLTAADLKAALSQFSPDWDALPISERVQALHSLVARIDYDGSEGKYGSYQIFFRVSGLAPQADSASSRLGETEMLVAAPRRLVGIHGAADEIKLWQLEQQVQPGRIPRISRFIKCAVLIDHKIRTGEFENQTAAAREFRVSTMTISRLLKMLLLAPDIAEEIMFLPLVERGPDPIKERMIRPILNECRWSEQRRLWDDLKKNQNSC